MGNHDTTLKSELTRIETAVRALRHRLCYFRYVPPMCEEPKSFGDYLETLTRAYSLGIVGSDEWKKRAEAILAAASHVASEQGLPVNSYRAIVEAFGYQIRPWPAIKELWWRTSSSNGDVTIDNLPNKLKSLLSGKITYSKCLMRQIKHLNDDEFRAALQCLSDNLQIGECGVRFVRSLMKHICRSRDKILGVNDVIWVMRQHFEPVPIIDDSEDKLTLEW